MTAHERNVSASIRPRQTRPSRRGRRQGRAATEGRTGSAGDGADRGVALGAEDRRTCLPGRGRPCHSNPVRRGGHAVALSVRAGRQLRPRCRWLYEGMSKAFAGNTARLAIVGDNPMLLAGEDPTRVAAPAKPIRSPMNRRWNGSSISTSTGTSSPIRAVVGEAGFFGRRRGCRGGKALRTRSSLPRGSIMMKPIAAWDKHNAPCAAGPNG